MLLTSCCFCSFSVISSKTIKKRNMNLFKLGGQTQRGCQSGEGAGTGIRPGETLATEFLGSHKAPSESLFLVHLQGCATAFSPAGPIELYLSLLDPALAKPKDGSGWKGPQWIIWSNLPAEAGSSQSTWHRIASKQFWNIPGKGDSTVLEYPH